MKVSCGILVGGESRRMGRDKALVDFGGRPLVVHVAQRLSMWSDDVFVVGKRSNVELADLRLRVHDDGCDARTPLAGVLAALHAARHPLVFVCATDMPHVSRELVQLMASRACGADAVVPERDGRLEPLHALWSTAVADVIAAALAAGERAPHRMLGRLSAVTIREEDWRRVDPRGDSFTNLNTPDDLRGARERAATGVGSDLRPGA